MNRERREHSEHLLVKAAGKVPVPATEVRNIQVTRFVVQNWSKLSHNWVDGPTEPWKDGSTEQYKTPEEARERIAEISDWEHVVKTRIVKRTVTIAEEIVAVADDEKTEQQP